MNPFVESYLDYVVFSAVIESVQSSADYTLYVIKVTASSHPAVNGISWHITKRFSDFVKLHTDLKPYYPNLPLPPKKLNKMSTEVIAERQMGLQSYLACILDDPLLCHSQLVSEFLYPSSSALSDFKIRASQFLSMELRNTEWSIVEPLNNIGYRLSKSYFLVVNKLNGNSDKKYCTVWHEFLHFDRSKSKELQKALSSLSSIQHPYIHPIISAIYNEKGVVTIREFTHHGSLLDSICLVKPSSACLKKYGKQRGNVSVGGLNSLAVKTFGRQILEALNFLHGRGWHHGHLSTRNVVVTSPGTIGLTDLENSLFDYQFMCQQHLIEINKSWTMQDIDIYCFGRCLLEMTTGEPFSKGFLDEVTVSINPEIKSVLQLILDKEAIKKGLPTASQLITHEFFASLKLTTSEKGSWRITTSCRQYMNQHQELVLTQLKKDQQLLLTSRRRVKTESRLAEEKKQRMRDYRKQMSTTESVRESRVWSASPARESTINSASATSSTSVSFAVQSNQTTTATSSAIPLPPPPPPLPPAPPPLTTAPPLPPLIPPLAPPLSTVQLRSSAQVSSPPRGGATPAFLNSIATFSKASLKKTATNDRSCPRL